tara:strand:+ start:1381 stop:2100 length:720 start_codon:yes stop_codon:yes gene_type:complete
MSHAVVFGNAPSGEFKSRYLGYRLDFIEHGKLRLFHDFLMLNDDESVAYSKNQRKIPSNRLFAIAVNNKPTAHMRPDNTIDDEKLGRNPKSNDYKIRYALLKKQDYDEYSSDIPTLKQLQDLKRTHKVRVKKNLNKAGDKSYSVVVEIFSELDEEWKPIYGKLEYEPKSKIHLHKDSVKPSVVDSNKPTMPSPLPYYSMNAEFSVKGNIKWKWGNKSQDWLKYAVLDEATDTFKEIDND